MAAIMGYCLFREKLPRRGTLGLIIGFVGRRAPSSELSRYR